MGCLNAACKPANSTIYMKVALISPRILNPEITRAGNNMPSSSITGLGYIAAYLRQAGHTALIFAPDSTRTTMETVWEGLEKFKPDIVGVSVLTDNFMEARKVVAEAKRRCACPVIMGGPHANALPRSTLEGLPALDAVIMGEGELPMLALATEFDRNGAVDFNCVPGAAFIKDGQYRQNPLMELIADLDILPYPALDLVSGSALQRGAPADGPGGNAVIFSSRGCPAQCTFCANRIMGRRFRARSPLNVVGEMEFLQKKYGTKRFSFFDDCFTADTRRTAEICDLIIKKDMAITWTFNGRVNTLLDGSFIALLKRAGCAGVLMGIETSSQRLSDLMKKGTTPAQAEASCALLRKHGIPYICCFMLGNEGETLATALDTIAFAAKLKPVAATFTTTIPFPGTVLFEKYYKDFDKPDTDWTNWATEIGVRTYEPRHTALSGRALRCLRLWAFLRFYSNPFQIFRMLSELYAPDVKPG